MLKFDINKIKQKLAEQKEKADNAKNKKKDRDIHSDPLVKVAAAGTYKFRAVPYVHNSDYTSEPFAERYYHFGIPGNAIFYCPAKNDNGKCAVCDCVWEQLKEYKGTDKVKIWRKYLPQKRVWIPGILRGRENEGLKYFALATQEDKMGKHHQKLFEWLTDEETYNFLDPEVGCDIKLNYEEYDEQRSKQLNNAKFGFAGLELGRPSPIAEDAKSFWDDLKKNMKNVDVDLPRYEKKTAADAEKVLVEWMNAEEKRAKGQKPGKPVDESKDNDGAETVGEDSLPVSREPETKAEPVQEKTSTNANQDRKEKAKAMLAKMKEG